MERQSGQRILNTFAGVGVALLLGSGMALAASGVFTVSDYRTTPPTSSPIPDAGAHRHVPSLRSVERRPAPPAPIESPPVPPPAASPPLKPAQRSAPPPVPDALVPSEQPDSDQAGGDRSDDGSVEEGGEPDDSKAGHEIRGNKDPGVGPNVEASGNRHREPRNHHCRYE